MSWRITVGVNIYVIGEQTTDNVHLGSNLMAKGDYKVFRVRANYDKGN